MSNKRLAVQAKNLNKHYRVKNASQHVLKDASFEAYFGELTMVMGASGSGKSTLVELISGLRRPDTGEVSVLNSDIWRLGRKKLDQFRMEHCGFVFQEFNLFPALTAREQIEVVLRYMNVDKASARSKAQACLQEVGLQDKAESKPAELSGGQKQRVAIARALAKDPKIIFADEPTSSLDSENGKLIGSLLQDIVKQRNTAVVVVTHDPELAEFADRIVRMENGRILEQSDSRTCTS